ncbi:putative secreted protein [Rhodobacter viridis]|uniref:Putative secreted protein n=1 Tax=Rhodobacter viridis TaxID=1054202 RepID=A0A318TU37_9RHOB|nr:VPLPA-CTERM sorting domain-containing protein [Rhodobacter viridis]PYF08154.1 putative secreted protein [Rhodobacter viridis]
MKHWEKLSVILAACAAMPGLANAATYDGTAAFMIVMPGAIVNTFGYARFPAATSGTAASTGNASASYTAGTETVATGGGVTVNVNGMAIEGEANPDGHALSDTTATVVFNLANLTGSTDVTPPAQTVDIIVTGSYTYALGAGAGGCSECSESALSRFSWNVTFDGTSIDSFTDMVSAAYFDPTIPFAYTLSLAPNSVTRLSFTATLDGDAVSSAVDKVPVPAGAPLLISALFGIGAMARRRR